MAKIEPYLLNLAGEYRVCSELCKRGVMATLTYGNRKSADVYAINDRRGRALRIEVKASQHAKFVTSITQKGLAKDPSAPDFWVLLQMRPMKDEGFEERFFVLSHTEICALQAKRNKAYADQYRERHGTLPDFSKGVDNVLVTDVEGHEGRWSKIIDRLES